MPTATRHRQRLGDLLTELLTGLPGVYPPERPENVEHSYWSFPLRVVEEELGATPDEFGQAVNAEGIPLAGAWIGQPLYMFDALAKRVAFGTSDHPFDIGREAPVEYHEGLCPTAELGMKQLRTLTINERFTEEDIRDCATAIRKVAEAFAARR